MAKSMKNTPRAGQPNSCPECQSTHLVNRSEGCTICLDCGFVISAETAERNIHKEHKRQRPASCQTQSGLSIREKDNVCENLAGILEQWNQLKIGDAMEKNFALALKYITKAAIDLSIPRTALEKAAVVYRRIIEKRLVKGRSIRALAATAVYVGCRQCGIAVTTKRVANVSRISPRRITRFYRLVAKQISITLQPTTISIYAKDLSGKLQISERTTTVIEKLVEVLQSSKLFEGKDPTGVACAAIYISSILTGEKRTQREIAEAARITEQTIRARCRELQRNLLFAFQL